jgi:hypothetical protein
MGWVQLVRSMDDEARGTTFQIDPLALYSKLETPFCWFGVRPTLFDAPFRFRTSAVDWLAHSFLCFTRTAVCDHDVYAIAGFSWGFTVEEGKVEVVAPKVLGESSWDVHLPSLRARYPEWSFFPGLHDR